MANRRRRAPLAPGCPLASAPSSLSSFRFSLLLRLLLLLAAASAVEAAVSLPLLPQPSAAAGVSCVSTIGGTSTEAPSAAHPSSAATPPAAVLSAAAAALSAAAAAPPPAAAALSAVAPASLILVSGGGDDYFAGASSLSYSAPGGPAAALSPDSASAAASMGSSSLNFPALYMSSPSLLSSSSRCLLSSSSLSPPSCGGSLSQNFFLSLLRPSPAVSLCGTLLSRSQQQAGVSLLRPQKHQQQQHQQHQHQQQLLPLFLSAFLLKTRSPRGAAAAATPVVSASRPAGGLSPAAIAAAPAAAARRHFSLAAAALARRGEAAAAAASSPRRAPTGSHGRRRAAGAELLPSFLCAAAAPPASAVGRQQASAASAAARGAAWATNAAAAPARAAAAAASAETPAAPPQPPAAAAAAAKEEEGGEAASAEAVVGAEDIELLLAKPRGFCAGVSRAIGIVEEALRVWGPPVYVRHSIVHNEVVCEDLRRKGAIFVEEIEEIPRGAVAVFSAHGVSPAVRAAAAARELRVVDATCPLVSKVHVYVKQQAAAGYHIILIGHKNHVEVQGTRGEAPAEAVTVVETVEDVERLPFSPETRLYYVTQTTLSLDDCAAIKEALLRRYPSIKTIPSGSICYATTNRQQALRSLVPLCDVAIIVGSTASSNAQRLLEVATRRGLRGYLINDAAELKPEWLQGVKRISLSSSASTPEATTAAVIRRLQQLGIRDIKEVESVHELEPIWKFPRNLREAAKEAAARASQATEEMQHEDSAATAAAAAVGRREAAG